jgi:hypothetical protein
MHLGTKVFSRHLENRRQTPSESRQPANQLLLISAVNRTVEKKLG